MKLISYFLAGSLMFALHVGTASAEALTVNISARVTGVYDPGNVLGSQAAVGQAVAGSYTYETTVPDQRWEPAYGEYLQNPGQAAARFSVGSLIFESDNTLPFWTFRILVHPSDYPGYYSSMSIISPSNKPLANGASVMAFDINFSDMAGRPFPTDALPTVAPNLADLSNKTVYFSGELYGNWYNLMLEITAVETASGLVVSPASSSFAPQQRFDAALMLPPGSQVRSVQASRGGMPLPTQCNPASLTPQGNVVVLCTDAHAILQYGPAAESIEWRVELQNNSVLTKNVNWEIVR